MFANSLTRDAGLIVGPVMFEVLVQHYFERLKHDVEKSSGLKHDDVLYHEAFTIVKVSLPSADPSLAYYYSMAFLHLSTL